MHILVYEKHGTNSLDRLRKAIERIVPWAWVEEYQTVKDLSSGLRKPLMGRAVAILLARNLQDLMDMLSICDLLDDIPIILVVSDRDRRTISAAHTLRPRFLAFGDGDFAGVAAVLGKMLERMQSVIERTT